MTNYKKRDFQPLESKLILVWNLLENQTRRYRYRKAPCILARASSHDLDLMIEIPHRSCQIAFGSCSYGLPSAMPPEGQVSRKMLHK